MKTRSNARAGAQVNTSYSQQNFIHTALDYYLLTTVPITLLTTVFADGSKIKERLGKRNLYQLFHVKQRCNYTAKILTLRFNRIEQCIYMLKFMQRKTCISEVFIKLRQESNLRRCNTVETS